MNYSNHYLKPEDPLRGRMYHDDALRAGDSARSGDYRAANGWIWTLMALAAVLLLTFAFGAG